MFHLATVRAGHAPDLDVEVDPLVAAGEIPDLAAFPVVPPALCPPAGPTGGVFDRRVRVMMRAWGSPKIPVQSDAGGIPESDTYPTAGADGAEFAYADHARFLAGLPGVSARCRSGFPRPRPLFSPTHFHEDPQLIVDSLTCGVSSRGEHREPRSAALRSSTATSKSHACSRCRQRQVPTYRCRRCTVRVRASGVGFVGFKRLLANPLELCSLCSRSVLL